MEKSELASVGAAEQTRPHGGNYLLGRPLANT